MLGADRMARHWFPWLVGMPAETALAVGSVCFGGVLEQLPSLRIGFAHGGGAAPMTLGRWEHGFRERPDLCQTRTEQPPSSFLDKIWVDALVHDLRTLRFTVDLYGDTRVALGTDYPFPLGEAHPGALIRSAGFAPDAQRRLFTANAVRLCACGSAAVWSIRSMYVAACSKACSSHRERRSRACLMSIAITSRSSRPARSVRR
jgi:aminocarboxymuconate-semialdehyde decarboxylase